MACTKCGKSSCRCNKGISMRGPAGPRGLKGRDGLVGGNGTQGFVTYVQSINNEGEIVRLATSSLSYQKANIIGSGAGVGTRYLSTDSAGNISWATISSGGGIQSVVAGTNITVDNTDPLNPVVSSTASGGFSAVAPAGNLLRVATVGPGDVVLTAVASHISESTYSLSAFIDGVGSTVEFAASDSGTGEFSDFQLLPNQAHLSNFDGANASFFKLLASEAYLQSISIPNGAATAIGVNSGGKIVPVSSGVLSVVGGTDISIDNTDPSNPIINYTGAGGGVTSVTGTANRISSTGGATPVIDIDAAYVGQTSITTIGTISTGTVPASHVSAGTFGTGAYVMDTSLTNPLLIGGTGTTSTLTFRTSSGNSTTNSDFIWQTGNNGATERMRMLNAGSLIIGGTALINTNELLSVQGSTNGNVNYAIRNATAGTAARASAAIMSGASGLYLNALSSSYTTSGVNVQGKATIVTDLLGLNIGTTSAQSIQFWTNNTQKVFIPSTGGLIVGTAALATNATGGFLYIPTCAGTPTGVPTAQTGTVPMLFDTTNNKLYIYNGGWLGGTVPGAFI